MPRRLRPITLVEEGQPPALHRTLFGEAVIRVLERLEQSKDGSANDQERRDRSLVEEREDDENF